MIEGERGITRLIWRTILPARMVLNAQFRIVYPFLPAISRGLGLPFETTALLLTLRGLIGALSPAFGYLSDRFGRKTLMLSGLVALVGGAALVTASRGFGVALIAFALLGFAKAAYDPAMQAFVSDAVPYEQRGKALGTIEYSWAGSWLVGVPIAGFLIARGDWRSPFMLIAALGIVCLALTWRARLGPGESALARAGAPARVRPNLAALLNRSTLAALAVCGLVIFANENFLMIYGAWMESAFALNPSRLGLVSTLVSVAELAGAALTVASVDRLGKRGGLLLGLGLNALAYLLLPLVMGRLPGAMAGTVAVALTSEFSIVATIPLVSEMAPKARGTLMAIHAALMALAASLASLVAPRLWRGGGLELVTMVSVGVVAVAAVLLWVWVRESIPTRTAVPATGLD